LLISFSSLYAGTTTPIFLPLYIVVLLNKN
jgi:hypothetical protein